jgi:putative ABC transport system ATP-binding protein
VRAHARGPPFWKELQAQPTPPAKARPGSGRTLRCVPDVRLDCAGVGTDETMTQPDGAAAESAIVQARGLCKRYGEGEAAVDALVDVSVAFPAGRFAAIMGPSGSGKSTLMHLLAGLDRPTAGTVELGGVELTTLDDGALTSLRRDRVGFIFQTFNLLPVLNAQENILLPLSIAGREVDKGWFEQLIDTVGIGDRLDHRPAELSGGQQQRVAVARALVSRPAVVFADEPSGNLDSKSSGDVLALLRHAVDDFGQTVVMVTHDAHAASFADRLLLLADGRIAHDGEAASAEQALDLMKAIG